MMLTSASTNEVWIICAFRSYAAQDQSLLWGDSENKPIIEEKFQSGGISEPRSQGESLHCSTLSVNMELNLWEIFALPLMGICDYLRLISPAKVTCKALLSISMGSDSSFDCQKPLCAASLCASFEIHKLLLIFAVAIICLFLGCQWTSQNMRSHSMSVAVQGTTGFIIQLRKGQT